MMEHHFGTNLSFLSINLQYNHDYTILIMDQHAYLQKFLEEAKENIDLVATTYPIDEVTTINLSEQSLPLIGSECHNYRSYLMTIYYMALRTRPDILLACAMLSTKASSPTVADWKNLIKLVCYLWTNPMVVLTYTKSLSLQNKI